MKRHLDNAAKTGRTHRATNIMLIQNPLDFIAEDHFRVKAVADLMRKVSKAEDPDAADLHEVTTFLTNELPLLMLDEDDHLIALLRQRVSPDLAFDALIARLKKTHDKIEDDRKDVLMRLLTAKTAGGQLTDEDRAKIAAAARTLLTEMIVENGRLLPLARQELTDSDIAILRGRMIQRRIWSMRAVRDHAG